MCLFRSLSLPAVFALILLLYPGVAPGYAVEQPENQTVRAELKGEVSSLNIGFEASSDELAAILNQMIRKEIYRGSTKIGGLTAEILRNGPISVTAADNYVYLTMPVIMSLSYEGFRAPAISSKLRFRLNARITPDWSLHAEIYYLGLSDLLAEQVGIGPFSMKPRSIMEGITDPLQRAMSDLISRKLNERYSLRAEVAKAWNAAQKPVLLDKNYSTWLKITPREVILYPPYAANNRVRLSLGLRSFAEVVVGPEPAPTAPVSLPPLKLANSGDRGFRLALNTDLFYREILGIAAPLLLNRELGSDGKSIILKDLDIYGKDDKLMIKVETRGSYEGVFYLTCRPSFNQQTNVFSVEDVDFDMSTKNILLKAAGWLLHSKIRNIIREKMNMDLTQRLEQARESAQKALGQVKLADHVFLKGQVNTIKLRDVLVQKEKLCIQLYTEGETTLFLR